MSEEELKRVLVVQSEQILAAGIESILNHKKDDLIVLSTTATDEATLADEVGSFEPNVIIADEVLKCSEISVLFETMNALPSLRVIIVDGRDNLLHVYERQAITVGHSTDLISAILT